MYPKKTYLFVFGYQFKGKLHLENKTMKKLINYFNKFKQFIFHQLFHRFFYWLNDIHKFVMLNLIRSDKLKTDLLFSLKKFKSIEILIKIGNNRTEPKDMSIENIATSSHPSKISQLYEEFHVLKNYLISTKKSQPQKSQTNELSASNPTSPNNPPPILSTPQKTKPHTKSKRKQQQNSTNKSNPPFLAFYQPSETYQQPLTTHQLIQEYAKHYEYSIRKVLEYKEKSGRKNDKNHNMQANEDGESKSNQSNERELAEGCKEVNMQDLEVKKRLLFGGEENLREENLQVDEVRSHNFQEECQNLKTSSHQHQIIESMTSFSINMHQNLTNFEAKLSNISENLRKINVKISRKGNHQDNFSQSLRKISLDLDDFNEQKNETQNKSVCSQLGQQNLEDV